MKFFVKLLIIFLAISGLVSILVDLGHTDFGTVDFYQNHGFFFLFFITVTPRLTLLFSSVPFGGLLWWIGFFIAPRILVAVLATIAYWQTNPILVTLSWLIAIGGESAEKWGFNRSFSIRVGSFGNTKSQAQSRHHKVDDNVVDAEFRRMDDQ